MSERELMLVIRRYQRWLKEMSSHKVGAVRSAMDGIHKGSSYSGASKSLMAEIFTARHGDNDKTFDAYLAGLLDEVARIEAGGLPRMGPAPKETA